MITHRPKTQTPTTSPIGAGTITPTVVQHVAGAIPFHSPSPSPSPPSLLSSPTRSLIPASPSSISSSPTAAVLPLRETHTSTHTAGNAPCGPRADASDDRRSSPLTNQLTTCLTHQRRKHTQQLIHHYGYNTQ